MKLKLNILFLLLSFITACSSGDDNGGNGNGEFIVQPYESVDVTKTNGTKLYMHYMPWFETPDTSDDGKWGQHWTMANKNPDKVDANGKREIAAHYYPLIGPYASNDPDVIEYHLLLMKYAGIDGILIDWYGTRNFYDYALNKRNTEAIVKVADKIGMGFAIVYEDQTLRDGLAASEKTAQAQADMRYMETNFFNREHYIKIDGKPLLMVFGPQEIGEPSQWASILSVLKTKPVFMPLYGHSAQANNATHTNAQGEFIWVDATDMDTKYEAVSRYDVWMGGAYPGFKGFYKDGGWGSNPLGDIDPENGALFRQLLQMATGRKADYLQLITWNDFGEGTVIEPTVEFGYMYLAELQRFTGVNYTEALLADIHRYYNLRKALGKDKPAQKKLDQIHYYWISLQTGKAKELMNELD